MAIPAGPLSSGNRVKDRVPVPQIVYILPAIA
jgi:hypothetical protein